MDAGAHMTHVTNSSFTLNGSRKKTRDVQAFVDYFNLCIDWRIKDIAERIITSIYEDAPDNDNDMYGFLHTVFHASNDYNVAYAKTLHKLLV